MAKLVDGWYTWEATDFSPSYTQTTEARKAEYEAALRHANGRTNMLTDDEKTGGFEGAGGKVVTGSTEPRSDEELRVTALSMALESGKTATSIVEDAKLFLAFMKGE